MKRALVYYLSLILFSMKGMEIAKNIPLAAPMHRATQEEVKSIVIDYLVRNTMPFHKTEDTLALPDSVNWPELLKKEVEQGARCEFGDYAIICAHGSIHQVDLYKKKVKQSIKVNVKIEEEDKMNPLFTAVACGELSGFSQVQTFLGEDSGRISVVGLEEQKHKSQGSCLPKSFGKVDGKVLSFHFDPEGKHIAVKYVGKDSQGLPVPCIALSKVFHKSLTAVQKTGSYLAVKAALSKSRSWKSTNDDYDWSPFVGKPCDYGVEDIRFDKDCCITKCSSTHKEERWVLKNPEGKPELIKLED